MRRTAIAPMTVLGTWHISAWVARRGDCRQGPGSAHRSSSRSCSSPSARGTTSLSNTVVAAQFVGVEPHVIDAWVRSHTPKPSPWAEEDPRHMNGRRGSVAAVWPELRDGARAGHKFADVTTRLGVTTQEVASAIRRDPAVLAELDEALMQSRDPKAQHGRRRAYWQGCWCPDFRGRRFSADR